jgi:Arc/MetJ-type ribon-helix-helix transcriptional regulator
MPEPHAFVCCHLTLEIFVTALSLPSINQLPSSPPRNMSDSDAICAQIEKMQQDLKKKEAEKEKERKKAVAEAETRRKAEEAKRQEYEKAEEEVRGDGEAT